MRDGSGILSQRAKDIQAAWEKQEAADLAALTKEGISGLERGSELR